MLNVQHLLQNPSCILTLVRASLLFIFIPYVIFFSVDGGAENKRQQWAVQYLDTWQLQVIQSRRLLLDRHHISLLLKIDYDGLKLLM